MKTRNLFAKTAMAAAAAWLCVTGTAIPADETAAAPLTDTQVAAVIKDPEAIKEMIREATADQVVEMLIQIIDRLDGMDIALTAKQAVVAQLFDITREMKGASAPGIIARVRGRVNPRLLPVIRRGGGDGGMGAVAPSGGRETQPEEPDEGDEAPPPAPIYPGQ